MEYYVGVEYASFGEALVSFSGLGWLVMADNKNKSILQMLRDRAGVQGAQAGLAGYEVARRTVINCPACGTEAGHGAGGESCSHCGRAFMVVAPGDGWYPKVLADLGE